jgi:hypothetical protein
MRNWTLIHREHVGHGLFEPNVYSVGNPDEDKKPLMDGCCKEINNVAIGGGDYLDDKSMVRLVHVLRFGLEGR